MFHEIQKETHQFSESILERISINTLNLKKLMEKLQLTPT